MLGFHELYERHAADVHRFALFLTGNPALADDLVSETFVPGVDCPRLDPRCHDSSIPADDYAQSVARHAAEGAPPRPARRGGRAVGGGAGDHLADLGWAERQLQSIAAGDRDALLLHARDGLSYEEVARRLDISTGAVKSRVFRARQALAALRVRREGEGDDGDS